MPRRTRAADRPASRVLHVAGLARIDLDRHDRTAAPEVILGEGKRPEHLVALVRAMRRRGLGGFVSRPTAAQLRALRIADRAGALGLQEVAGPRLLRIDGPLPPPRPGGRVALVTAGTADIPIAEEARALLAAHGVDLETAYDVGVAGLHRLLTALRRLERRRPSVYLAFAGREGALPTVLAGLVRAPVIGIPTSVGYGRGGRGAGALTAMLQSCAPVAVFNVDAAVPAALFTLQLLEGARRATAPATG